MKSERGVFSDIYSLDAPEEVFMIYQFNKLLNIFITLLAFPYLVTYNGTEYSSFSGV